jgi:ABC-type multidrug transport system fused ATPase/permease subunit
MLNSLAKAFVSDDGLRGVFSLIFTATILTIYELALFYYVVTPGILNQIDNGIKDLARALYTSLELNYVTGQNEYKKFFSDAEWQNISSEYENAVFNKESKKEVLQRIIDVLDTMDKREQRYINKINNNTKFVGALILIGLSVILLIIYMILKGRGESIGKCTWVNSIVTVGLILAFNYSFYLYGQRYQYIGSKGNEEMMVYILQHLPLDKNAL